MAYQMVAQWGMSDEIGPHVINMGYDNHQGDYWSAPMSLRANKEAERIVNQAYLRGKKILTDNRDLLEKLAQKLLDQDTVTQEELALMMIEENVDTAPYEMYTGLESDKTKLPFQAPFADFF